MPETTPGRPASSPTVTSGQLAVTGNSAQGHGLNAYFPDGRDLIGLRVHGDLAEDRADTVRQGRD
jgi:hypothetical protein